MSDWASYYYDLGSGVEVWTDIHPDDTSHHRDPLINHLHRIGGPALISNAGHYYYIHGVKYSRDEYILEVDRLFPRPDRYDGLEI